MDLGARRRFAAPKANDEAPEGQVSPEILAVDSHARPLAIGAEEKLTASRTGMRAIRRYQLGNEKPPGLRLRAMLIDGLGEPRPKRAGAGG